MTRAASIFLTIFLLAGICCASAVGAKSIELRVGADTQLIDQTLTGEAVGMIDDAQGSILGFCKAFNPQQAAGFNYATAPKVFEWSVSRFTGYGALPGYWTPGVEDTPAPWQSFGWRGKRMDVTGFYAMGARYYEPNSGRFISPDPLGHDASMGLYDYAGGDPINFADPRGRSAVNIYASAVTSSSIWSDSSNSSGSFLSDLGDAVNSLFGSNTGSIAPSYGIANNSFETVTSFSRPNTAMSMLSAGVNMIPGLGTLKSFIELSSGNDLFTGEQISQGASAFNVLAGALPFAAGSVSKFGSQALMRSSVVFAEEAALSRGVMNIGGGAAKTTPSAFARSQQGSGAYPGVDRWRDITLKKGTIIYGGEPGQSAFYTTQSAIGRTGDSATDIFQGLQVAPHPVHGYRPAMTAYEVIDDVPAAFGRTFANPQHGAGGLPQVVVPDFSKFLRPIHTAPLSH